MILCTHGYKVIHTLEAILNWNPIISGLKTILTNISKNGVILTSRAYLLTLTTTCSIKVKQPKRALDYALLLWILTMLLIAKANQLECCKRPLTHQNMMFFISSLKTKHLMKRVSLAPAESLNLLDGNCPQTCSPKQELV